jgi:hypothetical protein
MAVAPDGQSRKPGGSRRHRPPFIRCEQDMELAPPFLGLWPFSPDLRHFRWIMAAVELEPTEMNEAQASKP